MRDLATVLLGVGFLALGLWRLREKPEHWLPISLIVGLAFGAGGSLLGVPWRFVVFRLQAWGLFLLCPLWCALAGWRLRREQPVGTAVLGAAGIALLALGVDAFLIEPHALQLTRYTVESAAVGQPLRVALVADLQTDAPGPYEAEALRRILAEEPDLLLFAGDYAQAGSPHGESPVDRVNELFREVGLRADLGMFAVRGNTERDGWEAVFDGTAVTASDTTRSWPLGPVTVTTLGFHDGFFPDLELGPQPGLHVVLSHAPDYALGEIEADLLLAGHTHGGQVRVPLVDWPILTFSQVPRAWAAGRTELPGGRTLIVSRGVGMERGGAPPMRIACRPELVIIDVVPG